MATRTASLPDRLWRIGRYPDPFAWVPPEYTGVGRFDDPSHVFRVLYAAEQRLACFVETLAGHRPDLDWLAGVRRLPLEPDDLDGLCDAGRVPDSWQINRRIGVLEPRAEIDRPNLRSLETRQLLRGDLAWWLREHGYDDFDLGDALSRDRLLTQQVSRWAFEHGYRALAYTSRFGAEFDCWVLCGGEHTSSPSPFTRLRVAVIERDDPDLIEAARLLGLTL